ncbi:MAG: phosphopantothenate/pantothenate synthetase [Promethearchaeota archaeon]
MTPNKNSSYKIPEDHPRYLSLKYRHKIIEGMEKLIVVEAGLIAHGRGECFDYIFGEKTNENAKKAMEAAVALILQAKHAVISVNGNTAALCAKELVDFSNITNAQLEVNLFYAKEGRVEAIKTLLENAGAKNVLGTNENIMVEIKELSSNRRKVDPHGIKLADVVFVPLEDGDRTEALKKLGKKVITVDLNPISRTSIWADITIVDNIIRVLPKMIEIAKKQKKLKKVELQKLFKLFNNKKNIQDALDLIINYIEKQKKEAFMILKD